MGQYIEPAMRKGQKIEPTKIIFTCATIQRSNKHQPYPSHRTKWTRPFGGILRGGDSSTSVIIKLIGSSPYNPVNVSEKLKITCQDTVIECPLALIEHHSTLLKNILVDKDICRLVLLIYFVN